MIKILNNYESKHTDNILQITAYYNNKLVINNNYHNFKTTDTMNVMSVTKTITSLAIGILLDKGYIKSVDDKVLDYFKDYKIPKGNKVIDQITIKQMLTMTAPYIGKTENWTKICGSDDWTMAALNILGGKEITNNFRYHTLGLQILYGIIENTTKMNPLDFINQNIFEPLKIDKRKPFPIKNKEEHLAYVYNKENHGHAWVVDPKNQPTAGWGVSLSSMELSQIGLMILNDGVYHNQRIISKAYLDLMAKPYVSLGGIYEGQSYGFLCWLPHSTSNVVACIGDGGNIIYINKEKSIVVSITGYFKLNIFDRVQFIEENIVKAIEEAKDEKNID